MTSHEQSIACEIRTLLELEKTLYRYDTVKVFYRCLKGRPDGLSNRYDSVVMSSWRLREVVDLLAHRISQLLSFRHPPTTWDIPPIEHVLWSED